MSLFLRLFESINPNRCLYPRQSPWLQRRLGGAGGRGGPDPGKPRAGLLELGEGRQRFGLAPGSVQPLDSRLRNDGVTEALAHPVLAKLELQPQDPQDHFTQSAPARSPGLEPPAKAGVTWIEVARGGVHDVLGMAFDHRHRRLEAIECGALLGPRKQAREVAAQDGANRGARVAVEQPARQRPERALVEPRRSAAYELLDEGTQMRPEPGYGGELNRVRALVNRYPAQEDARIPAQLELCGGEVGAHEDESRLPLRRHKRDVVLSEHLARPVADCDPGFGAGGPTCQRAGNAPERAGEREPVGDLGLEPLRELPQRS